jgi:hypothetical protein
MPRERGTGCSSLPAFSPTFIDGGARIERLGLLTARTNSFWPPGQRSTSLLLVQGLSTALRSTSASGLDAKPRQGLSHAK